MDSQDQRLFNERGKRLEDYRKQVNWLFDELAEARKDTARLHWWFDEAHEPEREEIRILREECDAMWPVELWIKAIDEARAK